MVIFLAIILVLNNLVKCEIPMGGNPSMGFLGPERNGMLEKLVLRMTARGLDRFLMGHSDLPAPLP